ncbi:MAG: hypothetical protein L3K17_00070 [Thermoplasmata archaeon]|nr:hypothetical protein [Thermoplasmata archaeon]
MTLTMLPQRPRLYLVALVTVACLLPALAPNALATPPTPPASSATTATPPMTNISYHASSDGFPLSYEEVLPAHFLTNHSYPLLVYLHGAGKVSNWTRGGSPNGLAGFLTNSTLSGLTLEELLANASAFGYIVIAPAPRSAEGFYTNSTCGGPEEQDTVDAIVHEERLHHIHSVYLMGDSMGSLGALALAGHRPGLIQGIALTGTITDAFEEFAYRPSKTSSLLSLTCGTPPSTKNLTAERIFAYLSVGRLAPKNFSGIRIWASAGALDRDSPNNVSIWPFEMVNFTLLNSSCLVASLYGEPANCTDPFALLHAANATAFGYRFLYEAHGTHLIAQLDPWDMFEYFGSKVKGGCFVSTFPPTIVKTCP